MTQSVMFKGNQKQTASLPDKTWNSFFNPTSQNSVTDDFMAERFLQKLSLSESLHAVEKPSNPEEIRTKKKTECG